MKPSCGFGPMLWIDCIILIWIIFTLTQFLLSVLRKFCMVFLYVD